MRTDRVFNTAFETSLRILLLLDVSDIDLDEQTIRAADFIATYGKEFELSDDSPNGDNPYMYCELAARKSLTNEAMKLLVLDGFVLPSVTESGFLYRITLRGHRYASSLESRYAEEYQRAASSALGLIEARGIASVFAVIREKARYASEMELDNE